MSITKKNKGAGQAKHICRTQQINRPMTQMTKEDRDLLLKDLCARLPYGVKYKTYLGDVFTLKDITFSKTTTKHYIDDNAFSVDQIKPCLRPMPSMTEEERTEYKQKQTNYEFGYFDTYDSIDWLNARHFDYRGLIGKGLALEAPENMYK